MTRIMRLIFLLGCLLSCFTPVVHAQESVSKTDIIKLDFDTLAFRKVRVLARDPLLMPAYRQLLKNADALLSTTPVSVMDKTELPPGGDKHDYTSLAPYWWPDPAAPDGLPYVRRDGQTNPEVKSFPDKQNLPKLCQHVQLLSLAYYFSGDEKYAQKATQLIKTWFLDTATKMNPNLNYSQAVKGKNDGRGEGVLDARHFIYLIDGIGLIKTSRAWAPQYQDGMQKWFAALLHWMNTSNNGKDEMAAKNNHGVWFDAQALAYSLFAGNKEMANLVAKRAAKRLEEEMDSEGFFPRELKRTKSLHYSVFILNAFHVIAQMSAQTSENLFATTSSTGMALQKATQAMLPYITLQKQWDKGEEIKTFREDDGLPTLLYARRFVDCKPCAESIKSTGGDAFQTRLINLL